jgi:Protein of unknown function (DUF1580)
VTHFVIGFVIVRENNLLREAKHRRGMSVSIKRIKTCISRSGNERATIDFADENVVTFTELARRLPCRRDGRPTHVSTIHRWRQRGLSGVRLEAVRYGSIWVTTWEAYQRFVQSLTAAVTNRTESIANKTPLQNPADLTDKALDELGL